MRLIAVLTMRAEIERDIARERLVAATSACFGVLAPQLVAIGIFGVASFTVAQRTQELGIRIALGASRRSVVAEALGETWRVFEAGLVVGLVVAVAGVRLISSLIAELLFGLTATDAANIAGVLTVIVLVAAACFLPASRATGIDPLAAIRHE